MKVSSCVIHGNPRWRVFWREGGKQRRQIFKTEKSARTFASITSGELKTYGHAWPTIPETDRIELVRAYEQARAHGYSVLEACRYFESSGPKTAHRLTVGELCDRCLTAKEAKGLRPDSLRLLRTTLGQFRRTHERKAAADIGQAEVSTFLANEAWGYWRRKGARTDLNTLFNWGIGAGLLLRNPVKSVEKPIDQDDRPPAILSVDQAEKVMELGWRHYPALVPWLSLCLFGGLRPREVERLPADALNLGRTHIRVAGAVAKTRSTRLVPLNATLKAWLEKYPGAIIPPLFHVQARKLRKAFGKWPKDVLRHSYISYELGRGTSVDKVADWAGNSPEIIYKHYRELVAPERAKAFWKILPS